MTILKIESRIISIYFNPILSHVEPNEIIRIICIHEVLHVYQSANYCIPNQNLSIVNPCNPGNLITNHNVILLANMFILC